MPYIVSQPGWTQQTAVSIPANVTTTATTMLLSRYLATISTPYDANVEYEAARQRDEERWEREERIREQRERYRAASRRATETLRSLLTEENQRRLDAGFDLLIVGSAGGQYRVRHGYQGNIRRSDGRTFCAHPSMVTPEGDLLPTEDAMIAQILALVTDEPAFLRVANAS